ncbi:MAG TPA: hypothetical protein GX497_02210 [Bacillus bacterium]|nr:hypothetical protein [Bacillus sp. (in: firmicutes)]
MHIFVLSLWIVITFILIDFSNISYIDYLAFGVILFLFAVILVHLKNSINILKLRKEECDLEKTKLCLEKSKLCLEIECLELEIQSLKRK